MNNNKRVPTSYTWTSSDGLTWKVTPNYSEPEPESFYDTSILEDDGTTVTEYDVFGNQPPKQYYIGEDGQYKMRYLGKPGGADDA